MGDSKRSDGAASDAISSGDAEAPGTLSFEGALDRLEGTVARLEKGEMPLEEALELFETGVSLSRQCSATLKAAERRIEILMADRGDANGEVLAEPFDSELDDSELDEEEADEEPEDFED